ncbi:hypothetical protein JCM16303_003912 [Sporobolomyces ruberrimus]
MGDVPTRTSHKRAPVSPATEEVTCTTPSLFTNLNPFGTLPHDCEAASVQQPPNRRHSAELRAAAANRFKHECTADRYGKRRKSFAEVEVVVTDRVRSTRLSSIKAERRRSSASRRRRSSALPRHSLSLQPGIRRSISPTDSPLPSPTSPTISPSVFSPVPDRRCAFSDEFPLPSSPPPLSPEDPLSSSSAFSSQLSLATTGLSMTSRLRPRSPQQFTFFDDPSPTPRSTSQPDYLESPSGVRMRFPLVFPSAPPRCSNPRSSATTLAELDYDDLITPTEGAGEFFSKSYPDQRSSSPPSSPALHGTEPSVTSSRPFPMLQLDFATLLNSVDPARRFSTSSSYHHPSPDHLVLTPSTIGFFRTPHPTSRSCYGATDVFADAFAGALETDASS